MHLDGLVGVFCAGLIADQEVVDGLVVHAAHRADFAGLRQLGRDIADQEGAFVLRVGDAHQVVAHAVQAVVHKDEPGVRKLGHDFHQPVPELPADGHDEIVGFRRVDKLGRIHGSVFLALDDSAVDAVVGNQRLESLVGGVIERTIAQAARHDNGYVYRFRLAHRKRAERQDQRQRHAHRQNLFHAVSSFFAQRKVMYV